ncbi:hypothetical protein ANSO36C_47830 [Nostoc cf. commune SO-36]|uniref:Uncharacterized protein n=1 Tax=Nostoc cf. commune SO-36 TaxID=449208 RepID=A0ABN6Q6X5_NOSCO|nr:hypothetical protein [Nostoc commune]BDI18981.1 hypothetical protein ANSO36C_47830 [Nostoc cf. commune SO-36]
MKKLSRIFIVILTFILWLGGLSPALADSPAKTVLGITSLYNTPEQQKQGVKVYQDILKYGIATPFALPPNFQIPATKEEFDEKVVPGLIKILGDGSVTKAWFDFQAGQAQIATKELFSIDAPLGQKIYSVVAGKPVQQCPLKIEDTQIDFFLDSDKAANRAKELDEQGYFIYVSPVEELRRKVLNGLYDQYSSGSNNPSCFLVNGTTKKITVDFQDPDIYPLLPPELQSPGKNKPLVFLPKNGNEFLYVVNARQLLS